MEASLMEGYLVIPVHLFGLCLEVLLVKMICYLQVKIGQACERNP